MLKGETIYLRMLEPEDWELTHKWHNDTEIQRLTCGPIRIVSKEIEKTWVNLKTSNNRDELYLAICLNSDNSMVGYISASRIDHLNQSCFLSGVVIGDKRCQDGIALTESQLLIIHYLFTQMNMYRITSDCLTIHTFSNALLQALYFQKEGVERSSVYKNGKFNDVCLYSLLRDEYLQHLENGDYNVKDLIKNIFSHFKRIRREDRNK